MASIDCEKATAKRDKKLPSFVIWCRLYYRFDCICRVYMQGKHIAVICYQHITTNYPGMAPVNVIAWMFEPFCWSVRALQFRIYCRLDNFGQTYGLYLICMAYHHQIYATTRRSGNLPPHTLKMNSDENHTVSYGLNHRISINMFQSSQHVNSCSTGSTENLFYLLVSNLTFSNFNAGTVLECIRDFISCFTGRVVTYSTSTWPRHVYIPQESLWVYMMVGCLMSDKTL